MNAENEEQEASSLCELCESEEATHVHSVEDGDPIAVCDHCCDRNCDFFNQAYWNRPKALSRIESKKDLGYKMTTQFTVTSASGVPAGSYNATFVGLEMYEDNAEKYGEGVILRFKISAGEHKGEEASRICSKKFSAKSNLYKFAKALCGRELESREAFDFAEYVGTKGMVIVEQTDGGSTRVATFLRAAE